MNYNTNSNTQQFIFKEGKVYYLSITMANCTYNGSVWVTDLSTLSNDLRVNLVAIPNLEFRGVGSNMVRGNHNSLTIGVGASYYSGLQDLTQTEAIQLRTQIRNAVLITAGLSFSEILIETAFVQSSTY